jgi:uncharacterized protein YbjT (DUF2867 family)
MIFVTGATGNVGSPLLQRLAGLNLPLRALSRRPAADLRGPSNVQWVQGDLDDPAALHASLQGVQTLVLISPAGPKQQQRECAVVDAALQPSLRRIVKLSVLGAGPQAPARLPQAHHAVEQHIAATGVPCTFVRPNLYYQTLLGSAPEVIDGGTLHAAAGDARISFTDARDVADVIAAAATDDSREGRIHEITGPQALGYAEIAAALARLAGRPVQHIDITAAQQHAALRDMGLDAWTTEAFVELFGVYRAGHGAAVLPDPIAKLTGHPARGLEQFLRDHAERFSPAAVAA